MPFTSRLARFRWRSVSTAGVPLSGVTVTILPRGATVKGTQSGGPGNLTLNVYSRGSLGISAARDVFTVAVGAGSTEYTVGTITDGTVQITGLSGATTFNDNDRLRFADGEYFPQTFRDENGEELDSDPLVTDSNGETDTVWVEPGIYDIYETGPIAAKLTQDVIVSALWTPVEVWVTDARFGAKGDNVTDDYDAFMGAKEYIEAITAGSGVQGGIIRVPGGIYRTRLPIVLDNRVSLYGVHERCTEIATTAGFTFNGTTDAIIQLGTPTGTSNLFSTRVGRVSLNCESKANSIGIYSRQANENSGWDRVLIRQAMVKGIFIDGTSPGTCRNMYAEGAEISIASATGIGLHLKNVAEQNTFNHLSLSAAGTTPTTSKGIFMEGSTCEATFNGVHAEFFDIGIDMGAGSRGRVNECTGTGNVTGFLRLNGQRQGAFQIRPAGSAPIVIDSSGLTGNTTALDTHDLSFYYIGATHADGTATAYTDAYSTQAGAPTTRATSVQTIDHIRRIFRNTVAFIRGTIASADTIDSTNFAQRHFAWSLTGVTPVTTITTDGNDDTRLLLINVGAGETASLTTGGNLNLKAPFAPTNANERILLASNGSTWAEVARSIPLPNTGRETLASASTVTIASTTWSVELTGVTTVTKIASASAHVGKTIVVWTTNTTGIVLQNGVAGTANDILTITGANITIDAAGGLGQDVGSVALHSNGVNWIQLSPVGARTA